MPSYDDEDTPISLWTQIYNIFRTIIKGIVELLSAIGHFFVRPWVLIIQGIRALFSYSSASNPTPNNSDADHASDDLPYNNDISHTTIPEQEQTIEQRYINLALKKELTSSKFTVKDQQTLNALKRQIAAELVLPLDQVTTRLNQKVKIQCRQDKIAFLHNFAYPQPASLPKLQQLSDEQLQQIHERFSRVQTKVEETNHQIRTYLQKFSDNPGALKFRINFRRFASFSADTAISNDLEYTLEVQAENRRGQEPTDDEVITAYAVFSSLKEAQIVTKDKSTESHKAFDLQTQFRLSASNVEKFIATMVTIAETFSFFSKSFSLLTGDIDGTYIKIASKERFEFYDELNPQNGTDARMTKRAQTRFARIPRDKNCFLLSTLMLDVAALSESTTLPDGTTGPKHDFIDAFMEDLYQRHNLDSFNKSLKQMVTGKHKSLISLAQAQIICHDLSRLNILQTMANGDLFATHFQAVLRSNFEGSQSVYPAHEFSTSISDQLALTADDIDKHCRTTPMDKRGAEKRFISTNNHFIIQKYQNLFKAIFPIYEASLFNLPSDLDRELCTPSQRSLIDPENNGTQINKTMFNEEMQKAKAEMAKASSPRTKEADFKACVKRKRVFGLNDLLSTLDRTVVRQIIRNISSNVLLRFEASNIEILTDVERNSILGQADIRYAQQLFALDPSLTRLSTLEDPGSVDSPFRKAMLELRSQLPTESKLNALFACLKNTSVYKKLKQSSQYASILDKRIEDIKKMLTTRISKASQETYLSKSSSYTYYGPNEVIKTIQHLWSFIACCHYQEQKKWPEEALMAALKKLVDEPVFGYESAQAINERESCNAGHLGQMIDLVSEAYATLLQTAQDPVTECLKGIYNGYAILAQGKVANARGSHSADGNREKLYHFYRLGLSPKEPAYEKEDTSREANFKMFLDRLDDSLTTEVLLNDFVNNLAGLFLYHHRNNNVKMIITMLELLHAKEIIDKKAELITQSRTQLHAESNTVQAEIQYKLLTFKNHLLARYMVYAGESAYKFAVRIPGMDVLESRTIYLGATEEGDITYSVRTPMGTVVYDKQTNISLPTDDRTSEVISLERYIEMVRIDRNKAEGIKAYLLRQGDIEEEINPSDTESKQMTPFSLERIRLFLPILAANWLFRQGYLQPTPSNFSQLAKAEQRKLIYTMPKSKTHTTLQNWDTSNPNRMHRATDISGKLQPSIAMNLDDYFARGFYTNR